MREFTIKRYDCSGYYYISNGACGYLWRDLEIHSHLGYYDNGCDVTKVPGCYATKAEAERYLMAYRVKHMKFKVRQRPSNFGWCVAGKDSKRWFYLQHDLELHCTAGNPGHWKTKYEANKALRQFKEKHSMKEDKLVINVKLNGVDTPLHEISEETLLRIKEASRLELVPVLQVADRCGGQLRLVLKVTDDLRHAVADNDFIVLNEGGHVVHYGGLESVRRWYDNIREFYLDEV